MLAAAGSAAIKFSKTAGISGGPFDYKPFTPGNSKHTPIGNGRASSDFISDIAKRGAGASSTTGSSHVVSSSTNNARRDAVGHNPSWESLRRLESSTTPRSLSRSASVSENIHNNVLPTRNASSTNRRASEGGATLHELHSAFSFSPYGSRGIQQPRTSTSRSVDTRDASTSTQTSRVDATIGGPQRPTRANGGNASVGTQLGSGLHPGTAFNRGNFESRTISRATGTDLATRSVGASVQPSTRMRGTTTDLSLPSSWVSQGSGSAQIGNGAQVHGGAVPGHSKLKSSALSSAGSLVGGAALGGSHVAASAINSNARKDMQKSAQEFRQKQVDNASSALQSAGLPSYLAYTGIPSGTARSLGTTQVAAGRSGFSSKIPGNAQSASYTGSTAQTALGWGSVI